MMVKSTILLFALLATSTAFTQSCAVDSSNGSAESAAARDTNQPAAEHAAHSSDLAFRPAGLDECAESATNYAESMRGRCGTSCEYGPDSDHHAIAVREFARCMACRAPLGSEFVGMMYGGFGEFAAWLAEKFAPSIDSETDNYANRGGQQMAFNGFVGRGELYMDWERQFNFQSCGTTAPYPVAPRR